MKTMNSRLAVSIVMESQKTKQAVYLKRGYIQVDAKSILGVMSLVDIDNIDVVTNDMEAMETIYSLLEEA
jgi:phosphotransferase system HPr-like phosphotransfer protein